MFYKSPGVVLRETDYKETDKLLTVLTQDYGLMTLKARGIRRKTSDLRAACQILTYSEFTWQDIKGKPAITEASALELFREKDSDIELLALCSYFAQVTEVLSQEGVPDPQMLSLLLNSLYAVCRLGKNPRLVKTVFELRIACIAGYLPDLSGCAVCGNPAPERFDLTHGVLHCAGCAADEENALHAPLTPQMLAVMRYIVSAPAKKLLSFSADENTLTRLNNLTEAFLSAQAEYSFFTLDFYKSLQLLPENFNV